MGMREGKDQMRSSQRRDRQVPIHRGIDTFEDLASAPSLDQRHRRAGGRCGCGIRSDHEVRHRSCDAVLNVDACAQETLGPALERPEYDSARGRLGQDEAGVDPTEAQARISSYSRSNPATMRSAVNRSSAS
jgi:hypothetical protein